MGKGCKVVVCGQAAVGKTAILEQLLYGSHTVGTLSTNRESAYDHVLSVSVLVVTQFLSFFPSFQLPLFPAHSFLLLSYFSPSFPPPSYFFPSFLLSMFFHTSSLHSSLFLFCHPSFLPPTFLPTSFLLPTLFLSFLLPSSHRSFLPSFHLYLLPSRF